MNSWLLIRRLRGPAFLILIGITALLNQWGVLSFGRSWPLYLILAGVIGLAERAALIATPLLTGREQRTAHRSHPENQRHDTNRNQPLHLRLLTTRPPKAPKVSRDPGFFSTAAAVYPAP